MTGHPAQWIEAVDATGCGLRVTFLWTGDRFGHTIGMIHGDRYRPLLATDSCCADPRWPASPPLQQLSIEPRSDGQQVALLVGMAGKSHWSLSVESGPLGSPELIFDAACRASESPTWLGTRYRSMTPASPHSANQNNVCHLENETCLIEGLEEKSKNIQGRVEANATGLAIVCDLANSTGKATLRWRYRVRLDNQQSL